MVIIKRVFFVKDNGLLVDVSGVFYDIDFDDWTFFGL